MGPRETHRGGSVVNLADGHSADVHRQILRGDHPRQGRLRAQRVIDRIGPTQGHGRADRTVAHVLAGKLPSRVVAQSHHLIADIFPVGVRRRVAHQHRARHHRAVRPVVNFRRHRRAEHIQILGGDRSRQGRLVQQRVVARIGAAQRHHRGHGLARADILIGECSAAAATKGHDFRADVFSVIVGCRISHQHRARDHRAVRPVVHLGRHRRAEHLQVLGRDRSGQGFIGQGVVGGQVGRVHPVHQGVDRSHVLGADVLVRKSPHCRRRPQGLPRHHAKQRPHGHRCRRATVIDLGHHSRGRGRVDRDGFGGDRTRQDRLCAQRVVARIGATQRHRRGDGLARADILVGKGSAGPATQGDRFGSDVFSVVRRRGAAHQHRAGDHRAVRPVIRLGRRRRAEHLQVLGGDCSVQRFRRVQQVVVGDQTPGCQVIGQLIGDGDGRRSTHIGRGERARSSEHRNLQLLGTDEAAQRPQGERGGGGSVIDLVDRAGGHGDVLRQDGPGQRGRGEVVKGGAGSDQDHAGGDGDSGTGVFGGKGAGGGVPQRDVVGRPARRRTGQTGRGGAVINLGGDTGHSGKGRGICRDPLLPGVVGCVDGPGNGGSTRTTTAASGHPGRRQTAERTATPATPGGVDVGQLRDGPDACQVAVKARSGDGHDKGGGRGIGRRGSRRQQLPAEGNGHPAGPGGT